MDKLFNQDYSLVHPEILTEQGRGARVADQIFQVMKSCQPAFPFHQAVCLDIGSSSGAVSQHFVKYIKEIHCIDTDEHAVTIGRNSNPPDYKLRFSQFNGETIPFPDNTFDLVIFRRVYSCCPFEKRKKLVFEIHRVLNPGGLCYFEGHNLLSLLEPEYKIPFLQLLPLSWVKRCLSLLGHQNYYLGRYQTFWGLRKLLNSFSIDLVTSMIIKHPQRYHFTRLDRYSWITRFIPLRLLQFSEPLFPVFIWVLQKPLH